MELEPTPTVFGCWCHALPRLMCKLGFAAVPKRDSELHLNSRHLKMRNSLDVMPNVRGELPVEAWRLGRVAEDRQSRHAAQVLCRSGSARPRG